MPNPRKYFGTDGIRGRVGTAPITPEFVLKLGWAAGRILRRKGDGKILIGKDTRISGYMFESALEAGLSAAGMDIHLLGPMPTPAIAYLTRTQRANAGIVISASHNPYTDNGIKFFSSEGTKLPDDVELAIEEEMEKPLTTVDSSLLGKAVRIKDAPGRYIEFCKSTVPSSVSFHGMKIVVDCANGAAYHIAPHVFTELGAEVIELSVNPDGFNINENCGSTRPELLQKMVLAENADIGIALDGDGDRVIMADHTGRILDGDELLYIIAKYYLDKNIAIGGVVGTVMSNMGLEIAFRDLHLPFLRTSVGDRYVMSALNQQGWLLGGEPSGHIVCRGSTTTGDGIITALQVLSARVESGKDLPTLTQNLYKYPQIIKNISLSATSTEKNITEHPVIKKAIEKAQAHLQDKGRILIRPSGTEALVRIMVEGENEQEISRIAETLADVVRSI